MRAHRKGYTPHIHNKIKRLCRFRTSTKRIKHVVSAATFGTNIEHNYAQFKALHMRRSHATRSPTTDEMLTLPRMSSRNEGENRMAGVLARDQEKVKSREAAAASSRFIRVESPQVESQIATSVDRDMVQSSARVHRPLEAMLSSACLRWLSSST
jgi:hypothetical protein